MHVTLLNDIFFLYHKFSKFESYNSFLVASLASSAAITFIISSICSSDKFKPFPSKYYFILKTVVS